jgi:RND family efflux transporter MFP subunit
VRVVRVAPQPLEETLEVSGSLVSAIAVDVKTRFAGRLVLMAKEEGAGVRQGETLALLEETDARLAVGQAQASLGVAQAALERARVGEEHARAEKERAENLLRSGGITEKDYQAAQMAARDAQAQVRLATAQVEQAQQTLAQAEKHLRDCRIVSPIDGEVERKYLNPGGWVDGNTLLYRLVNNQRLELETRVASSEIARVKKGQRLRFKVAAFPEDEFLATVIALGPAVQIENRSVLVRSSVPNGQGKLRAGMFVKGRLITGTKAATLVVPSRAVWHRAGQPSFVFVVEEGRARRREVTLGIEQVDAVEIQQGLREGEVVIAEQNLELADGARVTPQP